MPTDHLFVPHVITPSRVKRAVTGLRERSLLSFTSSALMFGFAVLKPHFIHLVHAEDWIRILFEKGRISGEERGELCRVLLA